MLIVVGGMIGLGKSSVAEILGEHFKSDVFYESVDDNPILPLFYSESEEEIQKKRYPFLLQLYFLNTRFKSIKEALVHNNNVLDRSIYEDWYFAKKNMELGRINELEMKIYEDLLHNMLEELEELPKKAPDVMVYLKGSFETVLNRIALRGREFEIDDSLKEYYHFLWKDYDAWVENCYNASEVLIIDMDNMDVVNNEADKEKLIELVEEKLREVRATEEIA
ncbi:deoxynucleoside kinase [Clostridium tertium]|jgi:deoxyadenosine/deoxycytidine kinase|uniref:deoxynucleoside kinase n=1 Tax=Clostridium TaxID=1485 RepID=UPI00115A6CD8|nr:MULTISPECIES: deoxynucleoside kinase [Clostridium]MBS5305628.1 deoxynucleoside kinase [Clostridium sp.]MDB1923697.1 deoxynucleoside kinase [Clostridium tertium]MDB1925989.1 deoxynucleoside kinase [Clostridium tertium]MDB1929221.1 deoxynucleoside kinase [Clostridium tertium]MDB1932760.1 deoxynucleoside kinase [Clostridium tertium]